MEDSTAREKIMKKVRDALIEKTEIPYPVLDYDSPVFEEVNEALDVAFAEALVRISGKFVYCESEDEFLATLKSFILDKDWGLLFSQDPEILQMLHSAGIPSESKTESLTGARIGISRCEFLIARLGSVMVSSRQNPGRRVVVYPEIHLILAYSSQLVPDLKHALSGIRKKYRDNYPSMISLISGPSRTADIEKTLVMGAHGPRELYVFMIDDTTS